MSKVYEALLRHPELLTGTTTVLGAEADLPGAWASAVKEKHISLQTWNLQTAEAWKAAGVSEQQIHFGLPEPAALKDRNIILLWPKAKDFARALVQMLSQVTSQCYIVAANDTGGKSVNTAIKAQSDSCIKTDSARHCTLWQVTLTSSGEAVNWLKLARSVRFEERDFMTLPGVFGHGKLDAGTAQLLEHVPAPGHGRILDLGCGSGIIGLTMKGRNPSLKATLSDVDAFALRSAQLNSVRMGLEADILPSDGLKDIEGRFDIIYSNPPFHQGKQTDYDFARRLFSDARKHLTRDGQLWIVANRHLAYEEWAKEAFRQAEIMVQANGFKVICVSEPT